MDNKIKEFLRGYVPLVVVLVLLLFLANPSMFQNNLYSNSPNSFHASDAYAHLAYINDVIEVGNYNHEAQFYIGFTGDKLSPREPPLMLFYVAFLTNLLGIPSYVAAVFGLLLGILLSISIVYILIKKFSPSWAIAFLPTTLFLFTFPFSALINWGFWKACFMYFILITGFILFFSEWDKKKTALFVVLLASLIMASPALLPYFLMIFLLKLILEKSCWKNNFKLMVVGGVASLIITFHYFMNYSLARTASGENKILDMLGYQQGYHLYSANAYASHFGIVWYLSLIGFAYGLYWIFKNWKERESYKFKLYALFSFFFIVFLLPAIGITRIYQFRLVWPLFVAVLIGLSIYLLINLIKEPLKKIKIEMLTTSLIISGVLLVGLFYSLTFSQDNHSITSEEYWQVVTYVHDNTPQNSTILVIDSILSQNSVLLNLNRKLFYYESEQIKEAIKNNLQINNSPSHYYCAIPEKSRDGFKIYSTGDLVKECEQRRDQVIPPCAFDYLFINKQFASEAEMKLVQDFVEEIDQTQFQKIQEGQVLLLKNLKVCPSEI